MRAVRIHRYGGPDVLQIDDVPTPEPGPDEVLVRVRASSINPAEAAIREGLMTAVFPMMLPHGEGTDLAGVIAAVGSDVVSESTGEHWQPGAAVFGWTNVHAAHAEYVVVPAAQLAPIPPGLSMDQAGSLCGVGATAVAAIAAVGLRSGETVVISGAAGGVGVLATQLATRTGATVVGLASEQHHDWLRSVGAVPLRYSGEVRSTLADAAPGGIDAWIDLFGGGYVEIAIGLGVAPDRINTIVDFAAAAQYGAKTDGNAAGASIANVVDLGQRIAAGDLELPIAATFPLDEVAAAYELLAARHTNGKIVLRP